MHLLPDVEVGKAAVSLHVILIAIEVIEFENNMLYEVGPVHVWRAGWAHSVVSVPQQGGRPNLWASAFDMPVDASALIVHLQMLNVLDAVFGVVNTVFVVDGRVVFEALHVAALVFGVHAHVRPEIVALGLVLVVAVVEAALVHLLVVEISLAYHYHQVQRCNSNQDQSKYTTRKYLVFVLRLVVRSQVAVVDHVVGICLGSTVSIYFLLLIGV